MTSASAPSFIADRVRDFDRATAIPERAIQAMSAETPPLPARLGSIPYRAIGGWLIAGGPFRGHRFLANHILGSVAPSVAAVRLHVEGGSVGPVANPYANPPEPTTASEAAVAPKLSAVVSAHNEEDKLAACLSRLRFADEVVAVLDRCTDGTKDIAARYADRVVEGGWDLEGDRRNAAIAACRGTWVLEVDADEHVTPDLADDIQRTIATSTFDYHEIPVDNVIGGTLVRKGWGASYGKAAYPGLFRRGTKTWGRQRVHPSLQWTGAGGRGPMLTGRVTHYVDRDVSDMIRRLNSYSTARARDAIDSGQIASVMNNARRFLSRFYKCYHLRGGRDEGGYGYLIALFAGLYPVLSYAKAAEARRTLIGED